MEPIVSLNLLLPYWFGVGGSRRDEVRAAIVQLVDDLLNTQPNKFSGLCSHINNCIFYNGTDRFHSCPRLRSLLHRYIHQTVFPSWPHYSGNYMYPVPSAGKWKHESPGVCYQETDNKWNKRTKYGQLRLDLLHYTCEQLLAQVADK